LLHKHPLRLIVKVLFWPIVIRSGNT